MLTRGSARSLWAIFFSAIQVAAYRRALGDWPPAPGRAPPVARRRRQGARLGAASTRARSSSPPLLATRAAAREHVWPLLLGVTLWLVPAWLLSRPDNDAVPLGLALAGLLAFAALTGGLLSGAGLELTLQRVLRAVLLVAVATWMRAAAGPGGLRETFRRTLRAAARAALRPRGGRAARAGSTPARG